ncbi:hypothetical protein GCM10028806_10510 [Spirosoma terrae]|uniref:Uncharacterized protein n=1 Tax=Spirosoma terrae TaxID=1968276 RepID=A0A6L9LF50_9BACT|nr:hypothetical protein [Spirosoma terrae]NDU99235.1 hypothetical protein [Spirosoma terrae]
MAALITKSENSFGQKGVHIYDPENEDIDLFFPFSSIGTIHTEYQINSFEGFKYYNMVVFQKVIEIAKNDWATEDLVRQLMTFIRDEKPDIEGLNDLIADTYIVVGHIIKLRKLTEKFWERNNLTPSRESYKQFVQFIKDSNITKDNIDEYEFPEKEN